MIIFAASVGDYDFVARQCKVTLRIIRNALLEAAQASRRLERQHPWLHANLKSHTLDMAWFLVEPSCEELRQHFRSSLERELRIRLDAVRGSPEPSPMGDFPMPPADTAPA